MSTRKWPSTGSLQRLAIWLGIVLIWEGAYRTVGWADWKFPAPSHVVDALLGMLNIRSNFAGPLVSGWPFAMPVGGLATRRIWTSPLVIAQLTSLWRLAMGFAFSGVLGTALGLTMWRWKSVDDFFGPFFLGLQTLPSVCWVPLAILILGLNGWAILFVLVAGSVFAIALALRDGLRTIPSIYQRAGLMLGARGWRRYWYVLLPASLPVLSSTLRTGFSFAWRSLLGAELILWVQPHGLGYLLHVGREFADVAQIVAVMGVMIVTGMLADRLVFAAIERRVHRRFGLAG